MSKRRKKKPGVNLGLISRTLDAKKYNAILHLYETSCKRDIKDSLDPYSFGIQYWEERIKQAQEWLEWLTPENLEKGARDEEDFQTKHTAFMNSLKPKRVIVIKKHHL